MERIALVVAGLALGVLVGVGAFALLDDDAPDDRPDVAAEPPRTAFPAVDHAPEAAEQLLTAWERWRRATFVAEGVWSRTLDAGGDPLSGPTLVVQDPPRRYVSRLGSVVERLDEEVRSCDPGSAVPVAGDCAVGASALDYDDWVARDLAAVEVLVTGEGRSYDVALGAGGCFAAEARTLVPAASWGRWAELCFDGETGVLTSTRIRRASAVDTEEIVSVRTEVTADDLAVLSEPGG